MDEILSAIKMETLKRVDINKDYVNVRLKENPHFISNVKTEIGRET